MRLSWWTAVLMMLSSAAHAEGILDNLRSYDLNDYAIGIGYSASGNPFRGGVDSGFGFPYLTAFRYPAFTKDWLTLKGGDLGVRRVWDNGWILGGVGRVNTSGTGATAVQELIGLETRSWIVEVAPLIGYRRWPVHFELKPYFPVFTSNGGPSAEFSLALPREFSWGWLEPAVTLVYQTADYNSYYYGVSESEAFPGIMPYEPDSSANLRVGLHFGYRISDRWLVSGSVSQEWLDSEITNSPVIDEDTVWRYSLGLAYNNDIFRTRAYDPNSFHIPGFEIRLGMYRNNINSKIVRLPTDGSTPEVIELEDVLGVDSRDSVLYFDGIWRFGHFHRLQVGYIDLGRDSQTTLLADLEIGDEVFPEGSTIQTTSDLQLARLAYGFSFINDAQKELGVLAGIHVTRFDAMISSADTGQVVTSSIDTPLPVIGAFLSVALRKKFNLSARMELFRLEFDHYSGSLNALNLALTYNVTRDLGIGLGYNYFTMNLDSPDREVRGAVQIRHNGPIVFAAYTF